ncbi:MAG: glycosyltransferase family 2 protein [Dehalococcoidia bacterium]|nr:glycosyltransferase family 2 protein [Dehalococcoidia bacterium]
MSKTFSILIPTYNEHDNIAPLLERIAAAVQEQNYEVLFVDDNSRDGTAELINSLSTRYPARVIVRKDKRGLATAVTDGFGLVNSDTILVMDADLQHPPEIIPALIKAIHDGADIAIASRYVKGGGTSGWSTIRKITSSGAIMLAHIFLPHSRQVKDPMSGFFVFKSSVIDEVKLSPIGYKILLEMLVVGKASKVSEVPFMFQLREKGQSKLNISQEGEYLKHLFSLMHRSGEILRFLKFLLVGVSGTIVNLGILWLLHDQSMLNWDIRIALLVAIEVSILTNFILNNYFTFRDRRQSGSSTLIINCLRYNFFSIPGGILNWLTTIVLTDKSNGSYIMLNLVGVAVAMLWNFIANSLWTWKKR